MSKFSASIATTTTSITTTAIITITTTTTTILQLQMKHPIRFSPDQDREKQTSMLTRVKVVTTVLLYYYVGEVEGSNDCVIVLQC